MKLKSVTTKIEYDTTFLKSVISFLLILIMKFISRLEEVVWSNLPKNIKCMLRDQMEKD